ncbi:esterase-like activity of phytase family protein [Gordonia sp. (in: high G+C Gram-positive bacteria)]|uniref:esterase-like activity of phytase family protein n=1 Tax=Gordonia sp. (in: high G+C Gram-positive bacteria) TaxID=84139 RepID=UPI0039E3A0AD
MRPFFVTAALIIGSIAAAVPQAGALPVPGACSPTAVATGYSDGVNKVAAAGERIGGLSALARDPRGGRYLALPDHTHTRALVWPLTGVDELPAPRPRIAGAPITLTGPDGRPVSGRADNEGLAVLGDGSLAVASERGPSVSVYDRRGRWRDDLPVPRRYRVAPIGRARPNASFEGLSATPSGDGLFVAMERELGGEGPRTRRILEYRRSPGGRLVLRREVVYRAAPGMRVAEIAAYAADRLLVLEAAYSPRTGTVTVLRSVDLRPPVFGARSGRMVADLSRCPTLDARSRQPQRNPLLDNYEGMAVVPHAGGHLIHLVSDDNYSPRQTTRLLTLWARLP